MIAAVGGFVLLVAIFQDTRTPSAVTWESVMVRDLPMERAGGLVLQEQADGVLYASDGFSVYRSEGDRGFLKVLEVDPPLGPIWAAYSRRLRNYLGLEEAIEVFPVRPDLLMVFVGGEIQRIDLRTGEAETVHRLRYFGRGEGRGIMPFGVTVDGDGRIYYGEYVTRRLQGDETVALFRSDDDGRSFEIVYEFPAIVVRHIHAIQWDPYAQVIWMGTGDGDEQSRVGFSRDLGETFIWIGQDSQDFRAVNFVFSEDSVDWLSDTVEIPARALRFHRDDWEIQASSRSLPSHGLYMQDMGDGYRLGTSAEATAGLWLIDPDLGMRPIVEWPVAESGGFAFPAIRLARAATVDDGRVHVSPLRVQGGEAAIYRFTRETAFAAAGMDLPDEQQLLSRDDP